MYYSELLFAYLNYYLLNDSIMDLPLDHMYRVFFLRFKWRFC